MLTHAELKLMHHQFPQAFYIISIIYLAMPSLPCHSSSCHPIRRAPRCTCAPHQTTPIKILYVLHTYRVYSMFCEYKVINIHYNISSTIKPPFIQSFAQRLFTWDKAANVIYGRDKCVRIFMNPIGYINCARIILMRSNGKAKAKQKPLSIETI